MTRDDSDAAKSPATQSPHTSAHLFADGSKDKQLTTCETDQVSKDTFGIIALTLYMYVSICMESSNQCIVPTSTDSTKKTYCLHPYLHRSGILTYTLLYLIYIIM